MYKGKPSKPHIFENADLNNKITGAPTGTCSRGWKQDLNGFVQMVINDIIMRTCNLDMCKWGLCTMPMFIATLHATLQIKPKRSCLSCGALLHKIVLALFEGCQK